MKFPAITKSTAINIFGSKAALARAIGITTQSLYGWPEHLTPKLTDRIQAAIIREGLVKKMRQCDPRNRRERPHG